MELHNKVALVTGAGSTGGIGAAVATRFAAEGAEIIISGRNARRAEDVLSAVRSAGATARFVQAELTEPDEIANLALRAGPVDILVNNAGFLKVGALSGFSMADFDATFDINVRANALLTSRIAPQMLARGAGSIINISSVAARRARPGMAIYGASKSAVEALTRSYAAEFASGGVRVNAIAPGTVSSDFVLGLLGVPADAPRTGVPLNRIGTPHEIAEAALFLASDRSQFVTGTVLAVDGGSTAL
ncbi:glucose 1-dehydrogenase [Herbiconiux sp. CPCC 205763]|uniref:Glucose 1-dehydrogenase n=1 Tax=Herbiconiux aconitum TaxID=2970913 RepID=A0ABT2GNJ6_9MICO|nr:glucose 1-dehydrogenase [Herbiconiux aconitum]MCS5717743.1 glucose 1-dehydrogenase [Herbiconiux aconitum]